MLVNHLAHCIEYTMLPGPFETILEQPEETLWSVFGPLPITAQDRAYVEQVVRKTVELIENELRDRVEDTDEDDSDVVVTPAPSAVDARPNKGVQLVNGTVIDG